MEACRIVDAVVLKYMLLHRLHLKLRIIHKLRLLLKLHCRIRINDSNQRLRLLIRIDYLLVLGIGNIWLREHDRIWLLHLIWMSHRHCYLLLLHHALLLILKLLKLWSHCFISHFLIVIHLLLISWIIMVLVFKSVIFRK